MNLVDVTNIAGNIQLAIAPVFLIAGVGALLNVLTNRLARVVDRWRALEREVIAAPDGPAREAAKAELVGLDLRMIRINRAILLSTIAVLLVCVVIVILFTGEIVHADLALPIAILFIAAMIALVLALLSFLGEIAVATRFLRVGHEWRRK